MHLVSHKITVKTDLPRRSMRWQNQPDGQYVIHMGFKILLNSSRKALCGNYHRLGPVSPLGAQSSVEAAAKLGPWPGPWVMGGMALGRCRAGAPKADSSQGTWDWVGGKHLMPGSITARCSGKGCGCRPRHEQEACTGRNERNQKAA